MRQMVDELKEKPQDKKTDDRLEEHSMSRKQRRAYKKQKLLETTEGMSDSEKRKYLLYYYKERIIFAVIALIAIIVISRTLYKNSRPTVLSYVVINCADQFNFNADAIDQYAKDIGKFDGYQLHGDTNVYAKKEEYSQEYEYNPNSQKYIAFQTMATADYYDVVITNMEGAVYCGNIDIFYPLDTYLDEAHYNKIKDRIVILKNMDQKDSQLAIDVSDVPFIKSLRLGYDDVYIGFAGDTERNHVAVNDFIDYLFP